MQQAALTFAALLKIYIIAESQARGAFSDPLFLMCVQWAESGGKTLMKNVQHFAQLTIFHDFPPPTALPAGNLHKSVQSICDTWRARLVGGSFWPGQMGESG